MKEGNVHSLFALADYELPPEKWKCTINTAFQMTSTLSEWINKSHCFIWRWAFLGLWTFSVPSPKELWGLNLWMHSGSTFTDESRRTIMKANSRPWSWGSWLEVVMSRRARVCHISSMIIHGWIWWGWTFNLLQSWESTPSVCDILLVLIGIYLIL